VLIEWTPKAQWHADSQAIEDFDDVADAEQADQGAPAAGGPHRPMPANVQQEPATIAAQLVQGYARPAAPWLCSGPCTGPPLGQAPAPAA